MDDTKRIIDNIECFLLDLDGTIYLGERLIDGATDFLAALRATGRRFCFMTNNTSRDSRAYIEKLSRMGIEIDPATQLVSAAHATISYLLREHPNKRVYLLGNDMLKREFERGGITLREDEPDVAVIGFDTTLTYEKLCRICDLVREGLPYIATHPDLNCPVENGFIPDVGSFISLIETSAGRRPDVIIGKPNREMINYSLSVCRASAEHTATVGDRIYTDVAAGVDNGLAGILVLSGETKREDIPRFATEPTLVFESVKEIIPYL